MKEIYGNLWEQPANAYVITTNGTLKQNGACVMGRGIALQARNRFLDIDLAIGHMIEEYGNNVHLVTGLDKKIDRKHWNIMTYPVKHNWWEKADLTLIEKSAINLKYKVDTSPILGKETKIVLPRPGCGNGQLKWKDVKPILERHLDSRFTIVERRKGK